MNNTSFAWLAGLFASTLSLSALASDGHEKFVNNCSGCHGLEAEGIPGLAPALNNPDLWNKLGAKRNEYIAGVVTGGLSGKLKSKGNDYDGLVMPPQDFIETADLVDITRYVINDVNKVDGAPDATLINQLKSAPKSHEELHKLRNGG
ncbi:c-type cytochrome [Buttiauxella brennerae]|jgi:mono/diheme cytochrome c family protein|uniref:c-type cytochrome n=1 Tax=Buttiauxella brennerae TaxID=82988 RepID=UPI00286F622F|nr:cytochrome c [Buttiauxella brennerae]